MVVNDRIAALRRDSPESLQALPGKREESLEIDGRKVTVITWHDQPSPGDHRIVVAAYVPSAMGLASRVTAEGFMLQSSGSIRPLTAEELQPFQ